MRIHTLSFAASLLLWLPACGEQSGGDRDDASPNRTAGAPSATAAPTGRTIEVRMITDEQGNYFAPAAIEAHRGDVLRFTLVTGVHNVHFTAERNPGISGLPPMSDMLQLPGQTYDLTVHLPPGRYGFQCDPHAALGMVGQLEVESD